MLRSVSRITERHLYRLRARYRTDGDEGLIHRLRGCLSNRGYSRKVRSRVVELYRERYSDYTITLNVQFIQLEKSDAPLPPPGRSVTVRRWLDNSLHIFFNNEELAFSIIHPKRQSHSSSRSLPLPPGPDHPW
jgi:hypothetical protein